MQISLTFGSVDEMFNFCKEFRPENFFQANASGLEAADEKEESKELTSALKKEFKLDDKLKNCKSILNKMIQSKGPKKVKEFFLERFERENVSAVLELYKDKYDELEEILLK